MGLHGRIWGGNCVSLNHMLMLQLARMTNRQLAYYGRSIGPFPVQTADNRSFKKLSLQMLNYFSFFSIRDNKSEALAIELKVPFVSTVDSAFLDSPKAD